MRKRIGITVFGCEPDEAHAFRTLSPDFAVLPTLISEAISADNAKLAAGNRYVSVGHKSEVSESTIRALKTVGVKYISTRSIGCNHIDTAAAQRMGIAVGTVAYSPDSVADYALMLMLMAIRGAKPTMQAVEKQDFRLHRIRGKELCDMTVGVIGTGHIGKAVVKRLGGFGCHILAYDNSPEAQAEYVPLDTLLTNSDIVTLHVPLCENTKHMIGRPEIEKMKSGAFLINTGRGALVDTRALTAALESGKLGGAALDVLEGEDQFVYADCSQKVINHPFLSQLQQMPNVIITPHTAYYTARVLRDTTEKTIQNCLDFERRLQHE